MNAFFIIPTNVKQSFGELFMTHPPLEKRLARPRRDRAGDGPAGLVVVGLGDILFGQKKLKGAKLDKLFALSTAQVTLEAELGLQPAGVGRGRLQAAVGGGVRAGRERDARSSSSRRSRLRLEGEAARTDELRLRVARRRGRATSRIS